MQLLTKELHFPNVSEASEDGLLAVGGDLTVERLLLAYTSGIFPWYEAGQPILWWSPDPRMVLFVEDFKVSKSLQKILRKQLFTVTFNQDFKAVIHHCARVKRDGQYGTWITQEMMAGYLQLHKQGHAISFEVWQDQQLVGGGYGIQLPEKKVFCGESMFSLVSNASKVGFYHLVEKYKAAAYDLIDCQVYTQHLESLGAQEIPRAKFLKHLSF
ncbi:leucyl/phenylalanyl-tRNA--protein transferase [Rasiella sp. SM2506]|uniref:leucyl/phenylalanyl-tRNA--protein transferase n=1 Tax=Rasiella sp. SM2506 TaxID=3423914 RepID=UPI003D7BAB07